MTITVQGDNDMPSANAGGDQVVAGGARVTLNGAGSIDPEDRTLDFNWQQTSGPTVALSRNTVRRPTFIAPRSLTSDARLEFRLTVTDGHHTVSDSVRVTVTAGSDEPLIDPTTDPTDRPFDAITGLPPGHSLRADPQDFEQRRLGFRTDEFLSQPAAFNDHTLSAIKADYAYARGYTGKGVTVGVIDSGLIGTTASGFDPTKSHAEFDGTGKVHPDTRFEEGYQPDREGVFHGTASSSIIAASKNTGTRMHGVAFDAQLLVYGVACQGASALGPVDITPESIVQQRRLIEYDRDHADYVNFMLGYNQPAGGEPAVRIVNNSYG